MYTYVRNTIGAGGGVWMDNGTELNGRYENINLN